MNFFARKIKRCEIDENETKILFSIDVLATFSDG